MEKQTTLDHILAIIAWSFQVLAFGQMPEDDHLGQPLKNHWRLKHKSKALKCTALLTEVRGDWEMFKNTFGLSGWADSGSCCFRCYATKQTMKDCSLTAVWRQQRKTTWDHFGDCLKAGKPISAIFSAPGLQMDCFVIDWLHACDLGVAQDFLGNLIFFLLNRFPGASQEKKLGSVFRNMCHFYRESRADNRLDGLTMGMIRKTDKKTQKASAPKLRASAGETRALIPWGLQIAQALLNREDSFENTVLQAAVHLNTCYEMLARANYNALDLAHAGRQFLLLYVSLSGFDENEMFWRFKPKHHLFQELTEYDKCNPSQNWTYRDEDFGGTIAATSRRRGGDTRLHSCIIMFAAHLFTLCSALLQS